MPHTRYDLAGRRAVVTGGAQGFGRAIAERFLAAGARVSLWDVNPELTAETASQLGAAGTVHTAAVDVSRISEVVRNLSRSRGAFARTLTRCPTRSPWSRRRFPLT